MPQLVCNGYDDGDGCPDFEECGMWSCLKCQHLKTKPCNKM